MGKHSKQAVVQQQGGKGNLKRNPSKMTNGRGDVKRRKIGGTENRV